MEKDLTCPRCEHKWKYTGKKGKSKYPQYTKCPNCWTSVKLNGDNNEQTAKD